MSKIAGLHLVLFIPLISLIHCGIWPKVQLDPVSQDFYDLARLIMTKEEQKIFTHLPDKESRLQFIQDFWTKRDPDPETQENEYKIEFYERVAFANRYFNEGIPGWKTDRGRIYIYLGPPDKVENRPMMNDRDIKGLIWWGYFELRFGVWFADISGNGRYVLHEFINERGESLLQTLERVERERTKKREDQFGNRYIDFDLEYDSANHDIVVSLPIDQLVFREEANLFICDFSFKFWIYKQSGSWQAKFRSYPRFAKPEEKVLQMEDITYKFPYSLRNGIYFVDVVLVAGEGMGKTRKLFKITVFN